MPDLEDKTRDELYELATQADIAGRSSMTKEELIEALESPDVAGATSRVVTPRENQHRDTNRELSGLGSEIPPSEAATADQTSGGGTLTGPDDTGGTAPAGTRPTGTGGATTTP